MEYLEKIIYNLLLYLIPGSFFLLGLLLAYWTWYRHAGRLKLAIIENEKLQVKFSKSVALNIEGLKSKVRGKIESVESCRP